MRPLQQLLPLFSGGGARKASEDRLARCPGHRPFLNCHGPFFVCVSCPFLSLRVKKIEAAFRDLISRCCFGKCKGLLSVFCLLDRISSSFVCLHATLTCFLTLIVDIVFTKSRRFFPLPPPPFWGSPPRPWGLVTPFLFCQSVLMIARERGLPSGRSVIRLALFCSVFGVFFFVLSTAPFPSSPHSPSRKFSLSWP